MQDWKLYFYYDETSPTGLRWNVDRFAGEFQSVKIASKDAPAGTQQFNEDGTPKAYRVGFDSKDWFVHRIIWELVKGPIPENMVVDHGDGNPFNNLISNLECTEQKFNCQNARLKMNNTTGVTGVFWGDKGYPGATYAIANWQCNIKGNQTRSFSVRKYGLLPSFKMAFLYRQKMIEELNSKGNKYTERHGK